MGLGSIWLLDDSVDQTPAQCFWGLPQKDGAELILFYPRAPESVLQVTSPAQLSSSEQSSVKKRPRVREKQARGVNLEGEGHFLAHRCIFILENWGPWTFSCRFMPNEMQMRALLF